MIFARYGLPLLLMILYPIDVMGADQLMLEAAKEFSALELLIKSFIVIGGLATVGGGIYTAIGDFQNAQTEGAKKFAGPLLIIIGVAAMSVSPLVNVGANTIYSDSVSTVTNKYALNHSIDPNAMMRYVDGNQYFQSAAVRNSAPTRILKILNMFLALYGWYSIYRGFSIWKISVKSGSTMAGTDFNSKKGYIFGHFIAGIGLIQIGPTLAVMTTFGATIVNAASG